jgi:glycosyltransferase involved in cell wall biosynthesis
MPPAAHPETSRHALKPATHARRSAPIRPRRILIDCTATYRCDFGGGIQRVVRNLVNSADSLSRELKLACQPVIYDAAAGFQAIDSLPAPSDASETSVFARVATAAPAAAARAPAHSSSALKRGMRRTLAAVKMLEPASKILHITRRGLEHARRPRLPREALSLNAGPGDLLLLPDTTWGTPEVWEGARAAQQQGTKVAAVVYDMIPLRFSHFCSPPFVEIFRGWWNQVRRQADCVACISNSVWEDVQDYVASDLAEQSDHRQLRGAAFRLGAGLDLNLGPTRIRPELQQLFSGSALDNPYVMAASFDVRKNHRVVLEAFDRLWAQGLLVRLVIIARKYRDHPLPLAEQVERHPELNRRLYWFYDIEDGELDYCYRRAAALITASYAEGFNLPIVESLSRGRPVLASDIPVHREVAGAHAAYFSANAGEALADLVLRHQRGDLQTSLKRLDDFRWPNWFESGRELLERVVELYPDTAHCARLAS